MAAGPCRPCVPVGDMLVRLLAGAWAVMLLLVVGCQMPLLEMWHRLGCGALLPVLRRVTRVDCCDWVSVCRVGRGSVRGAPLTVPLACRVNSNAVVWCKGSYSMMVLCHHTTHTWCSKQRMLGQTGYTPHTLSAQTQLELSTPLSYRHTACQRLAWMCMDMQARRACARLHVKMP